MIVKRAKARIALFCLLAAFALFPFVALVPKLASGSFEISSWLARDIFEATLRAFVQASASALMALVLGTSGALGLFWLEAKNKNALALGKLTAIVPSAAPALAAILAWMRLFPSIHGLAAIVTTHALMASGLTSVALWRVASDKLAPLAEVAWLEGARRSVFLRRAAWPALRGDLGSLALLVFVLSFASFSVPLALGGAAATTLEVVVYERIRMAGDFSGAAVACAIQTIVVFALAFGIKKTDASANARPQRADLLAWLPGCLALAAPGIFMAAGAGGAAALGALALFKKPQILYAAGRLAAGSLSAALTTGLICLLALLATSYVRPSGAIRRICLGYAAPSAALTGLGLLMILPEGREAGLIKISLGLALFFAPTLYRFRWDAILSGLDNQFAAATSLGASDALIWKKIALPQLWRPACALAGLAAFWAWGDFAIATLVSENRLTMGVAAQSALASYRIDAGAALVALTMLGGSATYALFWGAGNVDRL